MIYYFSILDFLPFTRNIREKFTFYLNLTITYANIGPSKQKISTVGSKGSVCSTPKNGVVRSINFFFKVFKKHNIGAIFC